MGQHDDEAFKAMIERGSLGTSGARRLRSRASASDLAQVRKVRDQAEKDRQVSSKSTSGSEPSDHNKQDAGLARSGDPALPPEVNKTGNSAPQPQPVTVEEADELSSAAPAPQAAASAEPEHTTQRDSYVVLAVDPQTGEVDAHGPFDGLTATLKADQLRRDFDRGGFEDVTVGVVHIGAQPLLAGDGGHEDEPSAAQAPHRSPQGQHPEQGSRRSPVTRQTARVLAVDDRRENLLALRAILEGMPIELVAVTSGEDALKRLLTEDYAMILLDAHMPGMDGFETAGRVKQRERTRHIPILFLTAVDDDPHLAFRAYQAGAVDYITKPFDPWVLRTKVAVFVELWTTHTRLRGAIDDALELLEGGDPADIARARAQLAAVRGARLGSAETGSPSPALRVDDGVQPPYR